MRRPAPTRRATSAVPEAVPPPRATSDRLQYETRWPRILLTKGSRPSSQFSASPRLSHARLFQVEVATTCAHGSRPSDLVHERLGLLSGCYVLGAQHAIDSCPCGMRPQA